MFKCTYGVARKSGNVGISPEDFDGIFSDMVHVVFYGNVSKLYVWFLGREFCSEFNNVSWPTPFFDTNMSNKIFQVLLNFTFNNWSGLYQPHGHCSMGDCNKTKIFFTLVSKMCATLVNSEQIQSKNHKIHLLYIVKKTPVDVGYKKQLMETDWKNGK